MAERRTADNERRHGERIARVEERTEDQARTLEALAPVAVHLAELNVHYADIKDSIDDIHPRLRKLEYAVLLLGAAAISPKLGGPALPDVVSGVLSHLI